MGLLTALDVSIEDFTKEERLKADRFGIDLVLLVANLRLTPEERIHRAEHAARLVMESGTGISEQTSWYTDQQILTELELLLALQERREAVGK